MIAHRLSNYGRKSIPDAKDMQAINRLALSPLQPSDVAVFTFDAANSNLDRDFERFEPDCLVEMAADANNEFPLVLESHEWGSSSSGVGRVYKAWTEERKGETWLKCSAYFVLSDPESAAIASKLDNGLIAFCSIGFSCPTKTMQHENGQQVGVYSTCEGSQCELLELSLVFKGAQRGAIPVPSKTFMAALTKGLVDSMAKKSRVDLSWILPRG
jgi:hypothetical protein